MTRSKAGFEAKLIPLYDASFVQFVYMLTVRLLPFPINAAIRLATKSKQAFSNHEICDTPFSRWNHLLVRERKRQE